MVFLIVLAKQGECYILTQIIPSIHTYRYERHSCSNIMVLAVIVVMEEQKKQKNMEQQEQRCQRG